MDKERIDQSESEGGRHHLLLSLVGEWKGVTRTWFDPGKLADESAMKVISNA